MNKFVSIAAALAALLAVGSALYRVYVQGNLTVDMGFLNTSALIIGSIAIWVLYKEVLPKGNSDQSDDEGPTF